MKPSNLRVYYGFISGRGKMLGAKTTALLRLSMCSPLRYNPNYFLKGFLRCVCVCVEVIG